MYSKEKDPAELKPGTGLRVFISSVTEELEEYWQAATAACVKLGFIPLTLEALDTSPDAEPLNVIDDVDIFLGIYAHRYGFVPSGSDVSIIEMEYDRAVARGIPTLIFIASLDALLPVEGGRAAERLNLFKERLRARHVVEVFRDVDSFRSLLLRSLSRLASGMLPSRLARAASTPPPPRGEEPRSVRGVNLRMLADAALESDDEDLLGFGVYADAIAGLIDHPETRTPLTLAINGPWGAGKSTLGRMVQRRLEQKPAAGGTRPHVTCWFNSWMHDDATDLAAAFAGQVASTADQARRSWRRLLSPLPASMSSPNQRIRRRFIVSLLLVVAALLVSLRLVPKGGGPVLDFFLGEKLKPLVEQFHPTDDILFFVGVGTLTLFLIRWLWSAARSVSDFVTDPKAAASSGSMDRVRSQLAKLIRQATPPGSRFVVFIDDLERCRPPRSVDVLEVVNQLLSHEGMVTVIMADMPAVAAAVEVKYENLAKIYEPPSGSERAPRNAGSYGRLYLQKIIQLQFDLPGLRSDQIGNLIRMLAQSQSVEASAPAPQDERRTLRKLMREIAAWPRRLFATGLVQQSWHPSFTWRELWRHSIHRPRIWARISALLALAIFAPLIFASHAGARLFYPDPRFRFSSTITVKLFVLRAIRFSCVFLYLFGLALLPLPLSWTPAALGLEGTIVKLLILAGTLIVSGVCAALEAREQWRISLEALATARRIASERIRLGNEDLDKIQAELRERSGLSEGDLLLVRERLYLFATSESDLFGEAQSVVVEHLPPLPRSAKRLLNSLRLHFYVAHQLKVLDDEITPAHLGKWVVLRERWPELAQVLIGSSSSMAALEDTDDKRWDAVLKQLLPGLERDADLKSFCRSAPHLGSVLARLVRLEAAKKQ